MSEHASDLLIAALVGVFVLWGVVHVVRRMAGLLLDDEVPYVSQDWLDALEKDEEDGRDHR